MEINRRKFINVAGVSALIAFGGGLTGSFGQSAGRELFPIPADAYADPLLSMTANQLRDFIGHTFTMTREGTRPISAVLAEVNVLEWRANTINGYYGECFSMILDGGARRRLEQGSYVIETAGLRAFSALVVPVGINRTKYEIIVNRLTR